ncbi:PASTA domain-containing protein [Streptomyces kroppenstedtii]|uniref:PASTA domain-containing protein n=1 Tax=Streptomyces kroppenstedtii TaxID=3051181 RepID=UPI0028D1B139|nr:PASTA domain-containing protein [Streptomyces sp. DSM 40484]
MSTRITTALLLTALAAATLTACDSDDPEPQTPAPASTSKEATPTPKDPDPTPTTNDPTATPPEADTPAPEAKQETATLPDMTGKVLQTAQDEAQALGFYSLTSSDATGQDRFQAFDRNWKVCSQTPKPGKHPVETTINFDTVKLDETC